MRLSSDLREFVGLLNSRGVEYVIVGGAQSRVPRASTIYWRSRILVRATNENATRLRNLLREFGFDEAAFDQDDFTRVEQVIQLGRIPNRIDLLTSISGVSTDEALATKLTAELDGVPVFILSKDVLIKNKRAVGRPQDLADLDALAD